MIAYKIEALLADKGYDADLIREELTKAGIEVIRGKSQLDWGKSGRPGIGECPQESRPRLLLHEYRGGAY